MVWRHDEGADSTAIATTFVWLGMVIAISFLEAPLKFRPPTPSLMPADSG